VSNQVDVQLATETGEVPSSGQIRDWAAAALEERATAELTVRIVDEPEVQTLNRRYRDQDRPTNVLSFPCDLPVGLPADQFGDLLGDVVICAPVVAREAREQGKAADAHWAHLVVHGVLHLLGYDHEEPDQAARMETRERVILAGLGFPDPYDETD
jgi:probable rRNA maturation factor